MPSIKSSAELARQALSTILEDEDLGIEEEDLYSVTKKDAYYQSSLNDIICTYLSEYKPTRLEHFFLFDTWTAEQGLMLIGGYDPSSESKNGRFVTRLDGIRKTQLEDNSEWYKERFPRKCDIYNFLDDAIDEISEFFESDFLFMQEIWNSGNHSSRNSPDYYINWALGKGFKIPWIDWAAENGYINSGLKKKNSEQDGLTIQKKRELILKKWLSNQKKEVSNTLKTEVWKELTEMDSSAFPPQVDLTSTIKTFFRKQELIKFKPGRKKG